MALKRLEPYVTPKTMSATVKSEMMPAKPPKSPDPARSTMPASVMRARDYNRGQTGKKK
jgi:hypothetical protein